MTKYLGGAFTVPMAGDSEFRDNWDRTFGNKVASTAAQEEPAPKLWASCVAGDHALCGFPEVTKYRAQHGADPIPEADGCHCGCHKAH